MRRLRQGERGPALSTTAKWALSVLAIAIVVLIAFLVYSNLLAN